MDGPGLSVRTRFERFPATIKGAFVARGEGRNPHQLRVRRARIVQLGLEPESSAGDGGSAATRVERALPVDQVTIDVPPHQDVYVPFEAPVGDMDPGWYGLELEADVDGSPRVFASDRRFAVAWPRSLVRSGVAAQDQALRVGESVVKIEKVQCTADSTVVRFTVDPPKPVEIRLEADGSGVAIIDSEFDEAAGRGSVTAYPLLRTHRRLGIAAADRGAGRQAWTEAVVDLR